MNFFKKDEKPAVEVKKDEKPANTAFPDIGDDRGLEDHVPGAKPGGLADPTVGSIEELTKRFDEQKTASEERENRLLEALANANRAPVAPVAVQPAVEALKPFEPTDLPDGVEDPAGYARVLQENIQGSVKHMLDSQASEAARNTNTASAYDLMWEDFKGKYEDLAAHEELVEIQAGRVAKTLAAQGVDVPTYMVQHKDRFLGDVAKAVGERLVTLGLGPKTDEHQPDPMKPDQRTAGLPGTGGGPAPAKGKDDEVPPQGGFIAQIQKTQKEMGLI